MEKLNMSWSLENLYPSFEDNTFQSDLQLLDNKINDLINWSKDNLSNKMDETNKVIQYLYKIENYRFLYGKLYTFVSLSNSANSKDTKALKYLELLDKKSTQLTYVFVRFSNWLSQIENLESIINCSEQLMNNRFYLSEIVRKNKYVLDEKEEAVIAKMRLTSSNAWANYKNQVASTHQVKIELNGKEELVGINKVKNMYFSTDKDLRKKAFYAELESNNHIAEGIAASLNNIKGEVLTVCELKGYESPLSKTLIDSRMDEKTLNTMLEVMKENLPYFRQYFSKKAELLGHSSKLPYYDVMAPIGNIDMSFTYEQARDFIVKHFSSFDYELGDLARTAFDHRWIDAEARDGKRGGAFCSNIHSIKESRILCSYGGSFKNVCTLAHELGHAYHGYILQKESILNSSYPMPLAETASIFAETLVRNAALEIASKEEALVILGTELVNCSAVIVDIFARFLFEKEFFERRKEGYLSLDEIKEIMVKAQKESYGEGIDEATLDPYAWIHKPHYYYAEQNFYNFPYAFGLLFAKGLYNMYLNEGKSFISKYNEVLRLTGQANVYDVAKFVGIDLHDKAFWQGSMDIIIEDIKRFSSM